jgi:8-oxo-dGTP pyrophosphatase MutT (NUDIX family)
MSEKKRKVQVVIAALDPSGVYKILLLMTNEKRGSFWQNVTGSVDEGETFEAAALRETIEETGLDIEDMVDMINLGLVHQFKDQKNRMVVEQTFLLVADKIWKVKIDSHEHQESHWCEMNKLSENSVKFPSNWESLQKAMQVIKRQAI